MTDCQRLAQAAEECIGAPYRLRGRSLATGVDCIGLVVTCLARIGRSLDIPANYQLRNSAIASLVDKVDFAGVQLAQGDIASGDIVLARPGPAQHHLLIATSPDRFVHAHAGLRRVVAMPGPIPWPVLSRWRLSETPVAEVEI
ncbi:NlpC/P60 family protein [Parerythrobacter jejuensis]|uniref:NlpC/P60 domain-containing protein n=1 Tax=Parerythrobacter jejuensis TaxID=795812 RepID=A0A845AYF2_9SPHN|nr:NlpC/P60 family protein [Parerythrobacter jejuensis]MXP30766.1 hypothetical protein [Parerythrobacter jejuensis]MXP33526.1 hypothetical protein [Parerythrobacter jejuensis]